MSPVTLSDFEIWNLAEPVHPKPSSLYPLAPLGVGTPYIESLSSYLTRLAEVHAVSVSRLIFYLLSSSYPSRGSLPTKQYAYLANGIGKSAWHLLHALEGAAARSDLGCLTLSFLQNAIAQKTVLRKTAAWCPACLEQWRVTGRTIYSPLLWSISAVVVCPVHSSPLIEHCPHCHSRFTPLRANARSGHCSICLHWLGRSDSVSPQGSLDERELNVGVARSVGQVLAMKADLRQDFVPTTLSRHLERCLNQTKGATMHYLSELAGSRYDVVSGWISGQLKPRLDQICRLSYRLSMPLTMLFLEIPPDWSGPEVAPRPSRNRRSLSFGTEAEIREILKAALSEYPPPSVAEVARRMKFPSPETLRYREPDLCRKIAKRRREFPIRMRDRKPLFKDSAQQQLEAVLNRYLEEASPKSLNEIAARLGYKSATSIRERCPKICQALAARRKQHFQQKRKEMRRALEDARTEEPPPRLREIARRLRFRSGDTLVHAFPEVCAAHNQLRKAWLQQHRDRFRDSIRQWIATEMEPTPSSVCHRFGISKFLFMQRFPCEYRTVLDRLSERNRTSLENRHSALRAEVFAITQNLRERNIYPSLPRVREALSSSFPRYHSSVVSALADATKQLGPFIRARDDLGRFC